MVHIWFPLLLTSILLLILPAAGHSISYRKLTHLEYLKVAQFDAAPHPKKLLKERKWTSDGYTTASHNIEYDDILRLTLQIYNQTINLHLTPNLHLFHPNAVVWHQGKESPLIHEQFRIYRGYVVGDMETQYHWKRDRAGAEPSEMGVLGWARIIIRQDLTKSGMDYPIFEGSFTMHGDMYHIKTSTNYELSKSAYDVELADENLAHMVIYRDSDTTPILPQGDSSQSDNQRGLDSLAFNGGRQTRHPVLRTGHPAARELGIFIPHRIIDEDQILAKRQLTSGCPTSMQTLYMGVAADCTYTKGYGTPENARIQIINNWNIASAVYERTFNIQLGLINITIMYERCPSTPEPRWNQGCSETYTMSDRLSDFSLWRSTMSEDGAGLWHLMSNCATIGMTGIAWKSQLCNTGLQTQESSDGRTEYVSGTSVSTTGHDEWKIAAHEIGHAFGAIHDCISDTCPCNTSECSCCPLSGTSCDAGGAYIMTPANNISTNSFSPCSIETICSQLPTIGTCLESPGRRVVQTLNMCGNGIKDDGEDCDPGGKETSCCDPRTCKFIHGAVCDDATNGCCHNCQLRPTSYLCREAFDECDIPEYCDGTSGDCPSDVFLDDGLSCGNGTSTGIQCASGQCTSRDQQCRQIGHELSITRACSRGITECQTICADPNTTDTCTFFPVNFLDGTPCESDGRCKAGSCDYGSMSKRARTWLQHLSRRAYRMFRRGME